MTSTSAGASTSEPMPDEQINKFPDAKPLLALEQTIDYLQRKDDTSRFVGLTFLFALLDNHAEVLTHPSNESNLLKCWDAIPANFLRRLLGARLSEGRSMGDAHSMNALAVAVIRAFCLLLPHEFLESEKMCMMCGGLVDNLTHPREDVVEMALQALVSITSHKAGAEAVLSSDCITSLIDFSSQNPLALQAIKFVAFFGRSSEAVDMHLDERWNELLPRLVHSFEEQDPLPVLVILGEILERSKLPEHEGEPRWLEDMIFITRMAFLNHPDDHTFRICRRVMKHLAKESLTTNGPDPFFPSKNRPQEPKSPRPFSYLFTNYLLIDIRSTIPSLLENISTPQYPEMAVRLAEDYDLVGQFICSVVQLESTTNGKETVLDLSPDLLLKLRQDLTETMSLTIEFFRDRWNADVKHGNQSPAGESNTELTAQIDSKDNDTPEALKETFEKMRPPFRFTADPIAMSGIQTLGIWLREDDNNNALDEAISIVDVLLALYELGGDQRPDIHVDYREPVLAALLGMLYRPGFTSAFIECKGVSKLFNDLVKTVPQAKFDQDRSRTYDTLSVLLAVVSSDEFTELPKAEWLRFIEWLGSQDPPSPLHKPDAGTGLRPIDIWIEAVWLAVLLGKNAPANIERRAKGFCISARNRVQAVLQECKGSMENDVEESLKDLDAKIEELCAQDKNIITV